MHTHHFTLLCQPSSSDWHPFDTKIAIESWSLNCWLFTSLCLTRLTDGERKIAPCTKSRVNAQRKIVKNLPPLPTQLLCTSYKNKGFDWSTLKPSLIALAGKEHAWTEQFFGQGSVLGPSYVDSPTQVQASNRIYLPSRCYNSVMSPTKHDAF